MPERPVKDRATCISDAVRPSLESGAEVGRGGFLRSLKRKEVRQRYGTESPPLRWGYKVIPDKWRWVGGLSVSIASCTCAECSILMHPKAEMFRHVVAIDLSQLCREIDMRLVAVYDPTLDNPCHFNIMPVDESIDDLCVRLKNFLALTFPQHLPNSAALEIKADEAVKRYSQVFQVSRDVLPRGAG